jgi:hypothetical protein
MKTGQSVAARKSLDRRPPGSIVEAVDDKVDRRLLRAEFQKLLLSPAQALLMNLQAKTHGSEDIFGQSRDFSLPRLMPKISLIGQVTPLNLIEIYHSQRIPAQSRQMFGQPGAERTGSTD